MKIFISTGSEMTWTSVFARMFALFILGVFLFFGYSILRVAWMEETSPKSVDGFMSAQMEHEANPVFVQAEPVPIPLVSYGGNPPAIPTPTIQHQAPQEPQAPILSNPQPPLEIPKVAGQTSEDLITPEPLQQTPPTVKYDPPEATDPLNRTVHMNAMFGSNLRHPEQLIEKRPRRRMQNAIDSGVASRQTRNDSQGVNQYSEEMIQNGGLMSGGLMANDQNLSNNVGRLAFSML